MTLQLPPPWVLACTGTSLTEGKLAAFPVGWVQRLMAELPLQPEAIGRIVILPFGHGGWTSADILAEAPALAVQRPTHILAESGDVNSCVVTGGVPAVSRALKTTQMNAMVAAWRVNNPSVDITFQTMNPVGSAGGTLRPNYADYVADTIANAAILGVGLLDHWSDWPNPIPDWMTNAFDQLHPVWPNVFEITAYRKILFWCRQKMAAWWGLSAPVAPTYPAAPDVSYLLIGGGGGGSDNGQCGGGGGAGGILRGVDYLQNLLGAFSAGAGGAGGSGATGGQGGDTRVGLYRAIGGGGGGYVPPTYAAGCGGPGGSSGGGGLQPSIGGVPHYGQGFQGGAGGAGGGTGGGGGCCGPGGDGASNGGVGGLGWQTDVPGDSQAVCGGGPGGTSNGIGGSQPAYGLGGGPTCFGGGGRGSTNGGFGLAAGGVGVGYIWYPGAPRCGGGTITSSGGFTVHKLTGSGTLA